MKNPYELSVRLMCDKAGERRKFAAPKLPLGIALFILSLILISGIVTATIPPVARAASIAPPFNLTSIDGTDFSLSDYRGTVVVLDLMASWCQVCPHEMPELSTLREERSDVVIMTISVDPLEQEENLRSFRETYASNADWLFARDTDKVWDKYRALSLPMIVIIDPEGYISFQKAGLVPAQELIAEVERAYAGGGVEEPEEPEEPEGPSSTILGLYVLALLTGLLSFFAPCAFPLLPGYISYYFGRYEGGPTLSGSVKAGIASATGINGMFALIGAAVAVGGVAVKPYVTYFTPVVGVVIVFLGLSMVFGRAEIFERFGGVLSSYSSKLGGRARYSGLFLYGVGYGLAAMGCQAPVFIALIFAGLATGGVLEAFLVFLSFSIGMGCMMITVSVIVGTAKMKLLERMRALTPYLNRACGVILVIVGVYFLWEYLI
ncbi:MAG: redoxin domain-containing protein [Methanomicrobia archaeon]|nr:redoxin domain-containing protein [Methanomicrobia archaeon]